jgi:proteasome lid subunit RPN8/RPN11
MIIIEPKIRALLFEDATNVFPDECCGFLFGIENKRANRIILEILVVNNSKAGDKTRRFEISPSDYMNAEKYALEKNSQLLGIYHSHPNHPAVPSEHDRKAAQPFFSYVIISVLNNEIVTLRSWRLNEMDQFEEEKTYEYNSPEY